MSAAPVGSLLADPALTPAGDGPTAARPDDALRAVADAVGACRLPGDLQAAGWHDVLDVVRAAAARGLDTPLADAALGAALASVVGIEVAPRTVAASGPLTIARQGTGWRVDGELVRVPWGRAAEHVVALAGSPARLVRLPVADATLTPGSNLAGEPRDTLGFAGHLAADEHVADTALLPPDPVRLLGALLRSAALAGALETLTGLVVEHAGSRRQFGRPIERFQAVQEHLVRIATESTSATMAVSLGRRRLDEGGRPSLAAVAVAKTRTAAAATDASRAAHQVVGAIGTTGLHPLGACTRRLWSWRDEHGTQRDWQRVLGTIALERAGGPGVPGALWPLVTGTEPAGAR